LYRIWNRNVEAVNPGPEENMAHPIIVIKENKPKLFIQVDYLDDQGKLKTHHKKRIEEIEPDISNSELFLNGTKVGDPVNGQYELEVRPKTK
jgi:hypothetical protein